MSLKRRETARRCRIYVVLYLKLLPSSLYLRSQYCSTSCSSVAKEPLKKLKLPNQPANLDCLHSFSINLPLVFSINPPIVWSIKPRVSQSLSWTRLKGFFTFASWKSEKTSRYSHLWNLKKTEFCADSCWLIFWISYLFQILKKSSFCATVWRSNELCATFCSVCVYLCVCFVLILVFLFIVDKSCKQKRVRRGKNKNKQYSHLYPVFLVQLNFL